MADNTNELLDELLAGLDADAVPTKDPDDEGTADISEEEAAASGLPLAAPPEPARKVAERRLVETLRERGFSELASEAIARTVVDPADARVRLQLPAEMRVPGASIYYITLPVWTPMVATYPANFREAEDRHYPIAEPGMPFRPLAPPVAADHTRAEIELSVESTAQIIGSLEESSRVLLEVNNLRSSITREGVLMPVILAAMRIEHRDGTKDACVLVSVDGSSRTAASHSLLGVSPTDVLYRFPFDERRFRQFVGQVRALAERDPDSLTEAEQGRLRALTIPASIIVGVKVHDGSDTARVIMSLVGQIHVDPPKPWSDGAELDAQGDAMLKELVDCGEISEPLRDYMAGLMTIEEARASRLPHHLDLRALVILAKMIDKKRAAARGVRRVVPKSRIEWPGLADVAAELAIRAYRGRLKASEVSTARAALQRVYRRVEFRDNPWRLTYRTPEELRVAAIQDVENAPSRLGASATELALLAAYHLTRYRILRRPDVRRSEDAEDKREPDIVLKRMAMTRVGIQTLYRAVVDGREGIVPRQVDEDGEIVLAAEGAPEQTSAWLRADVVPLPPDQGTPPPPERPELTPEQKLALLRTTFALQLQGVSNTLARIRDLPGSDGLPVIRSVGWPRDEAEDHIHTLDSAGKQVHTWMVLWQLRHQEEAESEDVIDEDEDEDEEV